MTIPSGGIQQSFGYDRTAIQEQRLRQLESKEKQLEQRFQQSNSPEEDKRIENEKAQLEKEMSMAQREVELQSNADGDTYAKIGKKNPNEECETCKNRKYQDGSDEMVSFKSPAHVSPQAAGSAVRAHEQEHVANAYKKANEGNGEVIQASVQIHTAICPECGRSYVAGGTTSTQIKYNNESNPYQQDLKAQDADKYSGMNVDFAG